MDDNIEHIALARRTIASGQARDLRLRYGLTATEVARLVGCSGAIVTQWETDWRGRSISSKLALPYGKLIRQWLDSGNLMPDRPPTNAEIRARLAVERT